MRLLERFSFRDPANKDWHAKADAVIDGASIPRPLWTLVGSPFTGDYRRASIVHDVACQEAGSDKAKRRAADRMYFHACRAGGCSAWEATIQYLGVRVGAAWPFTNEWLVDDASTRLNGRITRHASEVRMEADFQRIAELVLSGGETDDPDVLERRTDSAYAVVMGDRFPDI
jgi:hypothetical protein